MEACLEKGLAKSIGISNFTITKIDRLLKTAVTVPAVNQVECHPYFQQQKLKEYCDSKGEHNLFISYSIIITSMTAVMCLLDSYRDLAMVKISMVCLCVMMYFIGICFEAYSPLGNPTRPMKKDSEPIVLDDPVIKEIAEKHKATPAQVCMELTLSVGRLKQIVCYRDV